MKTIKILGTGCPNCIKTIENAKQAVTESGEEVKLEKVDDIMEIMKYDIMRTPAVVIDEDIKIFGRVPSVEEIKALFKV